MADTPFTYNTIGVSGYSGFSGNSTSGYSGFTGVSGYSGFSGISGWSGISGFTGWSGFSGTSGWSGFSGISGYSGFSGISGYSGFSGFSGAFAGSTGTSNYVAKFTGTSSLGNSLIYDNGSTVTINSTTGSSSTSTGALVVGNGTSGGLGVGGAINAGGNIASAGSIYATGGSYATYYANGSSGGAFQIQAAGTNYGELYGNSSGISLDSGSSPNLYLNIGGSTRGLFTSSAISFQNANVGIGTSSPRNNVEIGNYTSNQTLRIGGIYSGPTSGYTGTGQETTRYQLVFSSWRDVQQDTTGAKIAAINYTNYTTSPYYLVQKTDLAFFTLNSVPTSTDNTAEVMRITAAGNVGIGTTSPLFKLDVRGGLLASTSSDFALGTTGSAIFIGQESRTGNTYSEIISVTAGNTAYGNTAIQPAGGNVLIGTTTPLAGGLTIGNTTSSSTTTSGALTVAGGVGIQGDLYANSLNVPSSGARYNISSYSSQCYLTALAGSTGYSNVNYNALQHLFFVSGTEAMRITSAGNVGIGTNPLSSNTSYRALETIGGTNILSNTGGNYGFLGNNAYIDSSYSLRYVNSGYATLEGLNNGNGSYIWYTAPYGTAGNVISLNNYMNLSNSGTLNLSATTSSYSTTSGALQVAGGVGILGNLYLGQKQFINTTGPVYSNDQLTVYNGATGSDVAIGACAYSRIIGFVLRANSGTYEEYYCQGTGQITGAITTNGYATSYTTASDKRLKTPLRPWSLGDKFDDLPIGEFNWLKDGSIAHGTLAQDLMKVYPDAVIKGDDNDVSKPYSVDYGKLTVPLIAEVKSLRSRVKTLESEQAEMMQAIKDLQQQVKQLSKQP